LAGTVKEGGVGVKEEGGLGGLGLAALAGWGLAEAVEKAGVGCNHLVELVG